MITTTTYTVSTYNETPFNTVQYKGTSRLDADLKVMEMAKANLHGVVVATTTVENKEFGYEKTTNEIIKNF